MFGENEEILEDVNIDPGTYQGGKKDAKDIENKKLNEKKRAGVDKYQELGDLRSPRKMYLFQIFRQKMYRVCKKI